MLRQERVFAALVAAGLITTDNKVLLVERMRTGNKIYTLPTGHMKPGDKNLERALIREMKEELRIKVSVADTLGTVVRNKASPSAKLIEIFHCMVSKATAKRVRYEEKGEKGQIWLDALQALKLKNLDSLAREGLKRFLERKPFSQAKEGAADGRQHFGERTTRAASCL